jgi:quinoprotein dehydrogenase-associated probable ABC transporter substrate-binding protein
MRGFDFRKRALAAAGAALVFTATLAASHPVVAAERSAFRVCADPNYLPYSNRAGEGFENRIAAVLAEELGLPLEFTWFPQRMGFIRNTLRAEREGGGYKCDVVMGVPDDFELTITTRPYYRSTYALVYVKGRGLDDVESIDDLLNLEPARLAKVRFGMAERNPGTVWLAAHNMLDQLVIAYASQLGDPGVQPGELEQRDLIEGRIDATIMWGPIAGHFAKSSKDVPVKMIPMRSEPGLKLDFAISAGVRFGEGKWKNEIEALLTRNAARIEKLLREFNVPLVSEGGAPM